MSNKIIWIILSSILVTACAGQQPYGYGSNYGYNDTYYGNGYNNSGYANRHTKPKNVLIGGGVGAVAGAALGTAFGGNDLSNAGLGALAGGAVGAAVGAYVDHQQERQYQIDENGGQQAPYYDGYRQ
jgi:hypothetical protein